MSTRVVLDGQVLAPEEARVSVFDRGFLYGDSVYEVVRTYGGRPFALDQHLDRLDRSATLIGMMLPISRQALGDEVHLGLEAACNPESYIRVVVTRGSGEIGLDPALAVDPLRVVIIRPLAVPPAALYADGARAALVGPSRGPGSSFIESEAHPEGNPKTGNYLPNILALREAKARGAYEALLVDAAGHVVEGASSNVFVVRDGTLTTPPIAGILEGITRHHVLALAREAGLSTTQTELDAAVVKGADEVFITSTIREIVPLTSIDDRPVGTGEVGPVTRLLMERFRALTRHSAPR